MDNYNYPMGADTKDAPWNQVDNPEREIEVTVSITLSKTVKIKVSDYEITDSGKDEDEDIDYSNCDLKGAVEEQYPTPDKILEKLGEFAEKYPHKVYPNYKTGVFKGWNVDDFEVIEEY